MTKEKLTHKIDDLGRVLLPKALRDELGWEIGDTLLLCRVDGTVVLYTDRSTTDSNDQVTA